MWKDAFFRCRTSVLIMLTFVKVWNCIRNIGFERYCRSDVVYCQSTKMFMVLFNSVLYRAESNRLHGAFSISVQLYITSNNISFNLEGASTDFIVFTAECFVILRARYMLFTSDNFYL